MSVASRLGVAWGGPLDRSQGLRAASPQTRGVSARQPRGDEDQAGGEASVWARPLAPVRPRGGRGLGLGAPRPHTACRALWLQAVGLGATVQSVVVTVTGEEAGEEDGRAGHSPGTVRGDLGADVQVQAARWPSGLTIPGRVETSRELASVSGRRAGAGLSGQTGAGGGGGAVRTLDLQSCHGGSVS